MSTNLNEESKMDRAEKRLHKEIERYNTNRMKLEQATQELQSLREELLNKEDISQFLDWLKDTNEDQNAELEKVREELMKIRGAPEAIEWLMSGATELPDIDLSYSDSSEFSESSDSEDD